MVAILLYYECCIEKILEIPKPIHKSSLGFVSECLKDIFNKYDIVTIHHQYSIATMETKFIFNFLSFS